MTELERARERLEEIIKGCHFERGGDWANPRKHEVEWLCDQLSGFLNGETVKLLETDLRDYKMAADAEAARVDGLQAERDQLRERLTGIRKRTEDILSGIRQGCTTEDLIDMHLAAERKRAFVEGFEKALRLAEATWQSEGDGDLVLFRLRNEAAAIRRPPEEEGVPDGK